VKYRWLDSERRVVSAAKEGTPHGWLRGHIGVVLALPRSSPRIVGNCLVQFEDGLEVVCPAGTLRTARHGGEEEGSGNE
jgi:hypothetical protein